VAPLRVPRPRLSPSAVPLSPPPFAWVRTGERGVAPECLAVPAPWRGAVPVLIADAARCKPWDEFVDALFSLCRRHHQAVLLLDAPAGIRHDVYRTVPRPPPRTDRSVRGGGRRATTSAPAATAEWFGDGEATCRNLAEELGVEAELASVLPAGDTPPASPGGAEPSVWEDEGEAGPRERHVVVVDGVQSLQAALQVRILQTIRSRAGHDGELFVVLGGHAAAGGAGSPWAVAAREGADGAPVAELLERAQAVARARRGPGGGFGVWHAPDDAPAPAPLTAGWEGVSVRALPPGCHVLALRCANADLFARVRAVLRDVPRTAVLLGPNQTDAVALKEAVTPDADRVAGVALRDRSTLALRDDVRCIAAGDAVRKKAASCISWG
jgi:hypothetical protein